jgi:hypothetical protein
MAKNKTRGDDSTPGELPATTPDFGVRHDGTQFFQVLMEIHSEVGKLTEKVDALGKRFDKSDEKIGKLSDTITFVKGGLYIGMPLLLFMMGMLWYFIEDKVNDVFKTPRRASTVEQVVPPPPVSLPPPSNLSPQQQR